MQGLSFPIQNRGVSGSFYKMTTSPNFSPTLSIKSQLKLFDKLAKNAIQNGKAPANIEDFGAVKIGLIDSS
jgi:hypothetical protein